MSWQLLSPLKIGSDPYFVRVLKDVNILSIDLSHQRLDGGSELTLAGSNHSIPRAHLNSVRGVDSQSFHLRLATRFLCYILPSYIFSSGLSVDWDTKFEAQVDMGFRTSSENSPSLII